MNWQIKAFNELTILELYKILKVRSEVFVLEQTCLYLDIDGKDPHCFHLFLEDNGEILAYSRILPRGVAYKESSIGRILTNPKHRGNSYGRELMTKAINYIENELHETEIKIQAQSYLCKFYGSFGFKPISEEYLEDDIPHTDMFYTK